MAKKKQITEDELVEQFLQAFEQLAKNGQLESLLAKSKPRRAKVKDEIYTLKVQLKNVSKPPVWRKFEVSSQWTFADLHRLIQLAMGWDGGHLWQFEPKAYKGPYTIGTEDVDYDAEEVKIGAFLNPKNPMMEYVYDFGDDWIHTIKIEDVRPGSIDHPHLIAGKGLCPSDDMGGPWGWEDFKQRVKEEGPIDMGKWLQEEDSGDEASEENSENEYEEDNLMEIMEWYGIEPNPDGTIDFNSFPKEAIEACFAAFEPGKPLFRDNH
ncbi:MAG: plasmid pRiA4b ORF-3 family protein [Bacteroidales bacterium]|nr:plasmid pRiA4b ORF-3 family protein [Bacteroidales bacterium]